MTYGTAISCRFGPVSASGPAPERAAPSHGMTWAEMARSEGHRPRHAQSRYDARLEREAAHDAKVLAALLSIPAPATVNNVRAQTRQQPGTILDTLIRLADAGLVDMWAEDRPSHPGTRVFALTDAGRAKAEGQA